MRSALTCTGIVIGIAAVIALMEIGAGTAEAVRQTFATLGVNYLQVEPGASSSSGEMWKANRLTQVAIARGASNATQPKNRPRLTVSLVLPELVVKLPSPL